MSNSYQDFQLPKWKIFAAGISASACWGLATVLSKGALEYIPPLTQLVIQLLCSNIFLLASVLLLRISLPSTSHILILGLPGLLHPGMYGILLIVGLSFTGATSEVLISILETLITIILAWLLLHERMEKKFIPFLILAIIGVFLISVNSSINVVNNFSLLGNLLIFISTFIISLYTIICRRFVANFEPVLLMSLHQIFGFIGVFIVWIISFLWQGLPDWNNINQGALGAAALSGVTLYAIPFWLYTIVLKHIPANLASFFITLVPVFGISGAYAFLGEQLSFSQWIGAGLIVTAIFGVSFLHSN